MAGAAKAFGIAGGKAPALGCGLHTGGKAAGIQKFLDKEGLTRSNTMAFGDGENDMAMLRYAGIGVAMGNGKETLKEKADYVTTDIDDDGIANALIHFGLI